MRAADTLSVVFPAAQACPENLPDSLPSMPGDREIPDHPLVFETIRDCLVEAMDVDGMREMIAGLESGEIQVMARDTVEPSPLSHELINANPYAFLDDAPLEERRTRAVQLRRGLPASINTREDVGTLDEAAIAAATEEVAPTVRDVDELHDALLALWLVPEPRGQALAPGAEDWFAALTATGRACRLRWEQPAGTVVAAWVATDRLGTIRSVLGAGVECSPWIETPSWAKILPREETIGRIVGAHLDHRGPVAGPALAAELGLPLPEVMGALLALEGDGAILRGAFTGAATAVASARAGVPMREALATAGDDDQLHRLEWCNRRVLARIHRLTLARLRKEIEPVSAAALMRFLLRWQRVARNTQVIGADGLARILEQLQGFETAAGAWEREVLPARLHGYDQTWLDQLCLAGHVVWCRLSPRAPAAVAAIAPDPETDEEPDLEATLGIIGTRPARPDPKDAAHPYNRAEAAAEAARRRGATREQIAEAAAAAVAGERVPGYGEQVIVQLVTMSALMRRAADAEVRTAARVPEEPAARTRTAPSRSAPLSLMLRQDAAWLRAAAAVSATGEPVLGSLATRVRELLAAQGASFLPDIVGALDLPPTDIEDALWELVGAGLATADGFASLRVLVDRKRGEVKSLFDKALDSRQAAADAAAPPVKKWQDAIKRARTRDHRRPGHALRSLPTAAGRWSLLPPTNPGAIDPEATARQLLLRYGVVFRDLLARESSLPPWREVLIALRRLEARGEIRGGRFVTGFVGEQFALPEALDELRAARHGTPSTEVARVPATDPLNLVGVLSPGPRVPAIVGNAVLYLDGQPVASMEGGQLVVRAPLPPGARIDEDLTFHPPPRPVEVAPRRCCCYDPAGASVRIAARADVAAADRPAARHVARALHPGVRRRAAAAAADVLRGAPRSPRRAVRVADVLADADGALHHRRSRWTASPMNLGAEFHEAWLELAKRGRFVVIEAMGTQLCAEHPGKDIEVSLSCTYLDRPPQAYGGWDICAVPEL